MLAIAVPLTWSFQSMYSTWQVEQQVDALSLDVHEKKLHLNVLQVQIHSADTYIQLEVSSSSEITHADFIALKAQLEERLGSPIRLDITPRISL